jgi:hypothetical protein
MFLCLLDWILCYTDLIPWVHTRGKKDYDEDLYACGQGYERKGCSRGGRDATRGMKREGCSRGEEDPVVVVGKD